MVKLKVFLNKTASCFCFLGFLKRKTIRLHQICGRSKHPTLHK
jgi:hypothetical protein